jgi:hypothetical protein
LGGAVVAEDDIAPYIQQAIDQVRKDIKYISNIRHIKISTDKLRHWGSIRE